MQIAEKESVINFDVSFLGNRRTFLNSVKSFWTFMIQTSKYILTSKIWDFDLDPPVPLSTFKSTPNNYLSTDKSKSTNCHLQGLIQKRADASHKRLCRTFKNA